MAALDEIRVIVTAMNAGTVVAIGRNQAPTGIFKHGIASPWLIAHDGLVGDHQGDLKHHGGPEKAIHQYPIKNYAAWRAEYPTMQATLDAGCAFGENLCLPHMSESNVCVGDVFRFGNVMLQISQGRQPCFKLNLRFERPDMAWLVQKTGRTGWYYRVLETGAVDVGTALELVERPNPKWTIAHLNSIITSRTLSRNELSEMAELRYLSNSWRDLAQRRLDSRRIEDWSSRLGHSPES